MCISTLVATGGYKHANYSRERSTPLGKRKKGGLGRRSGREEILCEAAHMHMCSHSKIQRAFDKYFGGEVERRKDVCAFGWEPNKVFSGRLADISRVYNELGTLYDFPSRMVLRTVRVLMSHTTSLIPPYPSLICFLHLLRVAHLLFKYSSQHKRQLYRFVRSRRRPRRRGSVVWSWFEEQKKGEGEEERNS